MAVAIDAVQAGTGAENVSSFTYTHTPAGTPTAVGIGYAGYAGSGGSRTVTATYGGNSCTPEAVAVDPTTGHTPTILGLANPPSGAQQVVVACSASNMYGIPYSVTVTGSDTADCFSNSISASGNSGNTASATCTTSADEVLMDAITVFQAGVLSVGANQTQRATYTVAVTTSPVGGSTKLGSDGGVMSWDMTIPNHLWDMVAASFKVATGGGGSAGHRIAGGGWGGRTIGD